MMQLEVILTNCFGGFRLGTLNQMPFQTLPAAGDGFKPDSNGHGAQHLGENMGKPRWSPLKNGHLWTPLLPRKLGPPELFPASSSASRVQTLVFSMICLGQRK